VPVASEVPNLKPKDGKMCLVRVISGRQMNYSNDKMEISKGKLKKLCSSLHFIIVSKYFTEEKRWKHSLRFA
jgi:hypothetical protein